MKKFKIGVLVFAVLLVIGGGASSIVFYQKLEAEREASEVNKKFKYDGSDELVLEIKNGAMVYLSPSQDDYVHMNKQGLTFSNNKSEATNWDIQKKDKQTVVTIENKSQKKKVQPTVFSFNDISDDSISLRLPEKYKKIIIRGEKVDVNVDSLSLTQLEIQTTRGSTNVNNVSAQSLIANGHHGDIYVSDAKIEKNMALNTTSGNISTADSVFTDLEMKVKNGDTFTANTKGNVTIENQNGHSDINHTKGTVSVNNKNGDIFYHSNNITHDTTLETTHGNIQMEMDKPSYNKNKMDLKTEYGSLSIFNKNLSSETNFSSNKGDSLIKAISKNGDITVSELDPDDTQYDYH
ncbi:DUF4097 family beta strand repeat-containing protein [Vagococcus hydrophili]|uniref:DUF4097 domain-containing protein n=1 Tax=Vagococcus hydrophili TaxID=2714947 RepID=A0A6G8ASC8_9ENTE|nr:DUF4097 family beta strand repeat-containing protein [Vagococcus hydrophili]QIL47906.1 DUF4097 domain-containing protein [Vagococcus hydrophili]